jgi:hypothetical protein
MGKKNRITSLPGAYDYSFRLPGAFEQVNGVNAVFLQKPYSIFQLIVHDGCDILTNTVFLLVKYGIHLIYFTKD